MEVRDALKEQGIVYIHYRRRFDPSTSRDNTSLANVDLTIYYDSAKGLSAKNLTDEYEDPIYLLDPGYKSLGYFYLNDVNVYIKYKPTADFYAAASDTIPAVSEVVFTWNREHIRPNFPIMYERGVLDKATTRRNKH